MKGDKFLKHPAPKANSSVEWKEARPTPPQRGNDWGILKELISGCRAYIIRVMRRQDHGGATAKGDHLRRVGGAVRSSPEFLTITDTWWRSVDPSLARGHQQTITGHVKPLQACRIGVRSARHLVGDCVASYPIFKPLQDHPLTPLPLAKPEGPSSKVGSWCPLRNWTWLYRSERVCKLPCFLFRRSAD